MVGVSSRLSAVSLRVLLFSLLFRVVRLVHLAKLFRDYLNIMNVHVGRCAVTSLAGEYLSMGPSQAKPI